MYLEYQTVYSRTQHSKSPHIAIVFQSLFSLCIASQSQLLRHTLQQARRPLISRQGERKPSRPRGDADIVDIGETHQQRRTKNNFEPQIPRLRRLRPNLEIDVISSVAKHHRHHTCYRLDVRIAREQLSESGNAGVDRLVGRTSRVLTP